MEMSSWLRIKQTPAVLVKLTAIAFLGLAIQSTTAPPVFADDTADATHLPEIEAKTFNVAVKKRSRSGHVYLFDRYDSEPLQVGRLVLLRDGDQPVMAFRVLKDYPEKNQFAGKWLRRYRGLQQLQPDQQFLAVEKLADVVAPPLTSQDKADLKELEGEALPAPPPSGAEAAPATPQTAPSTPPAPQATASPAPPGPEGQPPSTATNEPVPAESLPPPAPNPAKSHDAENLAPELTAADERELDDLKSITAEELVPLDRDKYWATLGLGFFRNNGSTPSSKSGYLTGLDMKFAKTLKQYLYFKKKDLQDSIAVEAGLGYYKLISYAVQGDAFTVVPFTVTARYNLLFSENLGVFGYLGFNKNFVASSSSPNDPSNAAVSTASDQLNSFQPAFGVGGLFRVGPSWYIRTDVGYDLLGIALLLRF